MVFSNKVFAKKIFSTRDYKPDRRMTTSENRGLGFGVLKTYPIVQKERHPFMECLYNFSRSLSIDIDKFHYFNWTFLSTYSNKYLVLEINQCVRQVRRPMTGQN